MKDPRVQLLARNLIRYSVELQAGEKILIEMIDEALPLAKALVEEAYAVGGFPFVTLKNNALQRTLLRQANAEQLAANGRWEAERMQEMQAYIGLRASENVSELSDVPPERMQDYQQHWLKPVHMDIRVPNTKWCVLRYPNAAMAQLSNTSTEAFTDFFFDVCTLDYGRMRTAMNPLIQYMERTDRVRITGPGTDLSFSIKDIPVIPCAGLRNIPDGEVFTAPVRDSVAGYITYNTPAVFQGVTYENIRLEFSAGKIISATANHTDKINKVLDTDDGARFIGEFALGVNPYITRPMKDTLFDEKIMGSFHFTPGGCYEKASNGNHSAVHWDLVCIQTPEFGGGAIYFDDVLIRKDGRFVIPELECLNPENLK